MSTHSEDGTPGEPRPLSQVPPPPHVRSVQGPAEPDDADAAEQGAAEPVQPQPEPGPEPLRSSDRTMPRPGVVPAPEPDPALLETQAIRITPPPANQPPPNRQIPQMLPLPPSASQAPPVNQAPPLRQVPPPPVTQVPPVTQAPLVRPGADDLTQVQAARQGQNDATLNYAALMQNQAQNQASQNQASQDQTRRFEPQTFPLSSGDPQVLGSYRLLGRMLSPDVATDHSRPVVFLAEGPDQAHVVVKAARLDSGWEALERLRREARNASRVEGTQVARIVQAPAEDLGYLYIVQQFVHGTPLDQLLLQKPDLRLSGQDSHRLAIGLLSALRAIHQAGVTHRDIKPGNVIVTLDGPVVVDFGNSHHQDDDRITTQGGQRWGTPKYMSPEQFDELGVSNAIDLFGWGVTVVEAASGHHPFTEPGRPVVYQHVNGRIPPNISGVPVELIPVIRTALEPDARRRSSAAYLERRVGRSDHTQVQPASDVVDVPLPDPEKRHLDLPDVAAGFFDLRMRAEDALVDGHRWFLIACVVAVLLAVPAGIVLHVLVSLIL